MQPEVSHEIESLIDQYCLASDLNVLLKSFVQEKVIEMSIWSELTCTTHLMLGGTSPQLHRIAALTELMLLSFDMIDDLQDQDNLVKPWMICPQKYTLNAILILLMAFIGELGSLHPKAAKEVGALLASAIAGQQKDLNDFVQTEADYIAMIEQKSGTMLRFVCYMGYSLIGDLDSEIAAQVDEFANYIGVIAQLRNDLKDVIRYDIKNDLLQKKRTLPILFLLQESEAEFPPLYQFYAGAISEAEFLLSKKAGIQYIEDSGCIEYTEIIMALYKEKAEELFEFIPTALPWKDRFRELTLGKYSK